MKHYDRRSSAQAGRDAANNLKAAWKRFNWKLALRVLAWTAASVGVYQLCNALQLMFHAYLYPIAVGILAGAYVLLNGGFSRKQPLPEEDALPADWDGEKKAKYLEKLKKRREIAKKLLIPLFALMAAVFLDVIILSVQDGSYDIF